jgi:hypothetical protein
MYQLCLSLDSATVRYHEVFLNFNVQGRAVTVSGARGRTFIDDHGPLFGSLSQLPNDRTIWELGITITYANAGDYGGPNVEHIVYRFYQNGAISYRRSSGAQYAFTQGVAYSIPCPQV